MRHHWVHTPHDFCLPHALNMSASESKIPIPTKGTASSPRRFLMSSTQSSSPPGLPAHPAVQEEQEKPDKLASLQSSHNALRAASGRKIAELKRKIAQLEKCIAVRDGTVADLEEERGMLADIVQKSDTFQNTLCQRISDLATTKKSLTAQLATVNNECDKAKAALQISETELAMSKAERVSLEAVIAALQAKIATADSITVLADEVKDLKVEVGASATQIEEAGDEHLDAVMDCLAFEHSKMQTDLSEKIAGVAEQVHDLAGGVDKAVANTRPKQRTVMQVGRKMVAKLKSEKRGEGSGA